MRALKTITFVYETREDRVLIAINSGKPEAWACWLTRRIALALLERAATAVGSTSALVQRAPADIRSEVVAFERDAAMAKTAKAMSPTPPDVLKTSKPAAELLEKISVSRQGDDNFRVELRGESGSGAAALVAREEFQRILQMLQTEVTKANWGAAAPKTPATLAPEAPRPIPPRH